MLTIRSCDYQAMIDYTLRKLPEEACGLLAGRDGAAEKVFFISNQYHSPVRYSMEPLELLAAFRWMDEHEQELLGIFHSHPHGPANPSPTDIAEFNYPGVVSLIVFPKGDDWDIRGYSIRNLSYEEVPISIIEE